MRPLSSAAIAILKPWPCSPSTRVVADPDPVEDQLAGRLAAQAELALDLPVREPGVSVGTRNAVTPRGPASPVRANTSARSAQVPLVMNIFEPDSTQPSPSRTALVARLPASEPVSGSVSPKQASDSPVQRRVSQRCFCSSVP